MYSWKEWGKNLEMVVLPRWIKYRVLGLHHLKGWTWPFLKWKDPDKSGDRMEWIIRTSSWFHATGWYEYNHVRNGRSIRAGYGNGWQCIVFTENVTDRWPLIRYPHGWSRIPCTVCSNSEKSCRNEFWSRAWKRRPRISIMISLHHLSSDRMVSVKDILILRMNRFWCCFWRDESPYQIPIRKSNRVCRIPIWYIILFFFCLYSLLQRR